jgi:hypothetical protein
VILNLISDFLTISVTRRTHGWTPGVFPLLQV